MQRGLAAKLESVLNEIYSKRNDIPLTPAKQTIAQIADNLV
jgi:hypothetical protein